MKIYIKECQTCKNIVDKVILQNCKCGGDLYIDGSDYPYYNYWTRCKKCGKLSKIYDSIENLIKAIKIGEIK